MLSVGTAVTSGQVTGNGTLSIKSHSGLTNLKDEFFLVSPVQLMSLLIFGWPEHGSLPIPADLLTYRTGESQMGTGSSRQVCGNLLCSSRQQHSYFQVPAQWLADGDSSSLLLQMVALRRRRSHFKPTPGPVSAHSQPMNGFE